MENDITLELFHSPDPGSGKARVTLTEDFGKSAMISAALAIRQANLPYSPILYDETPNIPYADVEFQIEDPDEPIAAQNSIHATFTTIETQTDPRWTHDLPIIRPAAPVFLALADSFEPDPERKLTQEQAESMRQIAQRYAELAQAQNG